MGLYNFKPQFVPFITSGKKTHTIRSVRTHPDEPGDTLYLYTGLRTKRAKKIMEVECVKVENISIFPVTRALGELRSIAVVVNEAELTDDEREQLARRDGFSSFAEMMKFWTEPKNRLPFQGHIIHWRSGGRRTK